MNRQSAIISFRDRTLTFSAEEYNQGLLNPNTIEWDRDSTIFLKALEQENNVCFLWLDELCTELNDTKLFQSPVQTMHLGI